MLGDKEGGGNDGCDDGIGEVEEAGNSNGGGDDEDEVLGILMIITALRMLTAVKVLGMMLRLGRILLIL